MKSFVNDQPSLFFEPGLSIAVTGSSGSAALTTGAVLLEIAARSGLYGLLTRSVGPQIRGGESVAMVRLAPHPVEFPDDHFDLLAGLDWLNVERFLDEIPLDGRSLNLVDPAPCRSGRMDKGRQVALLAERLAREAVGRTAPPEDLDPPSVPE